MPHREMRRVNGSVLAAIATVLAAAVSVTPGMSAVMEQTSAVAVSAPIFAVDPAWPRELPNRWILGAVVGVDVDARDHVWIVHRPSTLQPNETRSIWRAAPPVLEFTQ